LGGESGCLAARRGMTTTKIKLSRLSEGQQK